MDKVESENQKAKRSGVPTTKEVGMRSAKWKVESAPSIVEKETKCILSHSKNGTIGV